MLNKKLVDGIDICQYKKYRCTKQLHVTIIVVYKLMTIKIEKPNVFQIYDTLTIFQANEHIYITQVDLRHKIERSKIFWLVVMRANQVLIMINPQVQPRLK